jgi:hypothetical protein
LRRHCKWLLTKVSTPAETCGNQETPASAASLAPSNAIAASGHTFIWLALCCWWIGHRSGSPAQYASISESDGTIEPRTAVHNEYLPVSKYWHVIILL